MTSTTDTWTSSAGVDFVVKVNGAPVSDSVAANLLTAEVESNMYRPDSFLLKFYDNDGTVLEEGGFQLATPVSVTVVQQQKDLLLASGEVTAVELEASARGRLVIVRGHDPSHRFLAGTNTKAWVKSKASDIVTAILGQQNVSSGQIDETDTVYDVLTQADVSNWAFIKYLAFLEGRDAYFINGKFNFSKLLSAKSGPSPVAEYGKAEATQLVFGENVLRLHGVITGTEQVSTVQARGWDPANAKAIVATGASPVLSAVSQDSKAQPDTVAKEFNADTLIMTNVPFNNQQSADAAANSLANQVAGSFAELEGECIGNGAIFAGALVSLGLAGDPFDGKYVVTSARHEFQHGWYRTWFRMGGRSDRSLLSLAGGKGDSDSSVPVIPGVVVGIVTQIKDDQKLCRVKVKLPWLDDNYESDWVRTVQIGASNGFGSSFVPDVGTEVLIAFDHGNPSYPYVIGNLYNGKSKPFQIAPAESPDPSDQINQRSIVSGKKHMLLFNDNEASDKQAIKLITGGQECSLLMVVKDANAESQPNITIDSKGNVTIKGAKDVAITATGKMTLQATQDLTLSGASVSVTANQQMKLTGTAGVTVSGSQIQLGG